MKRFFALMLMFVSSYAHADCPDPWLDYQSSTLYLSVTYSDVCYRGELVLNYAEFSKDGPQWPDPSLHLESTPFDRECPWKKKDNDGFTVEFSCREDGISPLSGATYRYKEFEMTIRCRDRHNDVATSEDSFIDVGTIEPSFICISGCSPTTPKKLNTSVYGEGCD